MLTSKLQYFWNGSLQELKSFVYDKLDLKEKWSSPGSEVKLFVYSNVGFKWYGPTKKRLVILKDDEENSLTKALIWSMRFTRVMVLVLVLPNEARLTPVGRSPLARVAQNMNLPLLNCSWTWLYCQHYFISSRKSWTIKYLISLMLKILSKVYQEKMRKVCRF